MGLLGRWLTGSLSLALGLLMAVLAMQAPAVTHDYAAALLQVAREARRDVDQRTAAARQFYAMAASSDDQLVEALQAVEPSNAETLAASLARARRLQAGYDRIAASQPLLQPIVALSQAMRDERGDETVIRRTLVETFTPGIALSPAAVVYGLVGLLIGTLIAQLLLSLLGAATGLATRRGAARRHAR
jgi:DUF2937 family protein